MGSDAWEVEGLGEGRLQSLWLGKQCGDWCQGELSGKRLEVSVGAVKGGCRCQVEFCTQTAGDGAPEALQRGPEPERARVNHP